MATSLDQRIGLSIALLESLLYRGSLVTRCQYYHFKGCLLRIRVYILFHLQLSGILLIVFGSIGVADEDTTVNLLNLIDGVSYVTDIISIAPYVEGVSIFMIVLGVFLFLLGGNGCHGIMRKNKRSICVVSSYNLCMF